MNRHRRYGSAQAEPIPPGTLWYVEQEIRKGLSMLPTEARSKLRRLAKERVGLLLEHAEGHLAGISEGTAGNFHRHSGQSATWLRALTTHPDFRSWKLAIRIAAWYRLRLTISEAKYFPTQLAFSTRMVQNVLHLHEGITRGRNELAHTSVRILYGWLETYMLDLAAIMTRLAAQHSVKLDKSKATAKEIRQSLFPESPA